MKSPSSMLQVVELGSLASACGPFHILFYVNRQLVECGETVSVVDIYSALIQCVQKRLCEG
jgi:hypothetical protein